MSAPALSFSEYHEAANLTAIIGAGPAGSACALWLHELGCPVIILEKEKAAGGLQARSPYENIWLPGFPGLAGTEVAAHIHEQLAGIGVPFFRSLEVKSVRPQTVGYGVETSAGTITAARVVLATGTRFRTGGHIASPTVSIGPGFTFEQMDMKGKHVAILGGGDNACAAYGFSLDKGAASCTIFARTLRAQQKLVKPIPPAQIVRGEFYADQNAMTVNGRKFDVFAVQYGFKAVLPPGLNGLALKDEGYVDADIWGRTNMPDLFAIGEIAKTFHPCVATSFAHGIQAAKYIQMHAVP